jgi:hypothetical protein
MSFVRSTPAPTFDCSFGHGEQVSRLEESLTVTVQQLMSTPSEASRQAKHVLFILCNINLTYHSKRSHFNYPKLLL